MGPVPVAGSAAEAGERAPSDVMPSVIVVSTVAAAARTAVGRRRWRRGAPSREGWDMRNLRGGNASRGERASRCLTAGRPGRVDAALMSCAPAARASPGSEYDQPAQRTWGLPGERSPEIRLRAADAGRHTGPTMKP